jgi:hypothetical protein
MKTGTNVSVKTIILTGIALAVAAFLIVSPVLAQEDPSSTASVGDSSTTTEPTSGEFTSAQSDTVTSEATTSGSSTDAVIETTETLSGKSTSEADDSSSAIDTSTTPAADSATDTSGSATTAEQPPAGLTEVHIIGTKYIDYFTDGTTVASYPGDPEIDSHFSEPNAPIPTREGLTWLRTIGDNLYDTPSGDLEVGQYALQSDGSYVENTPLFVSSTSSPAVLGNSISAIDTGSDSTSTASETLPDVSARMATGYSRIV